MQQRLFPHNPASSLCSMAIMRIIQVPRKVIGLLLKLLLLNPNPKTWEALAPVIATASLGVGASLDTTLDYRTLASISPDAGPTLEPLASSPHNGAVVVWPHHVGQLQSEPDAKGQALVLSGNDGAGEARVRLRSIRGAIAFRDI